MRTPRPDGEIIPFFDVEEDIDADNVWERRMRCTFRTCPQSASGLNLWLGGVVDRTTHIRLLVERMARDCTIRECPHPKEGVHR